ncbi:MAG: ATPase, partial [Gammaproteobacteria bacterium]
MRMMAEEFLGWEHRAISLLGMSGVGKTYLANKLPRGDWFHFSCDYRIGTKYLNEPILDNIKKKAMAVDFLRDLLRSDSIFIANNISVHNLEPLSTFLGKIGNPALGGLSIDEFRERQRLHREAEISAMFDVKEFIAKVRDMYGYSHFINDMGGSVCELDNDEVLDVLAEQTLLIYIRADHDMEEELIRRQIDNPKPLYYQ